VKALSSGASGAGRLAAASPPGQAAGRLPRPARGPPPGGGGGAGPAARAPPRSVPGPPL